MSKNLLCLILASGIVGTTNAEADAFLTEKSGMIESKTTTTEKFVELDTFSRISAKTDIKIHEDSTATILFENGRKELWGGPVTIRVLANESISIDNTTNKGATATILEEERIILEDTVEVSSLMTKFRTGKIAGIRMRGKKGDVSFSFKDREQKYLKRSERKLLDTTKKNFYAASFKSAEEFNPEFIKTVSVLSKLKQMASLQEVVGITLKRHPQNTLALELNRLQTK